MKRNFCLTVFSAATLLGCSDIKETIETANRSPAAKTCIEITIDQLRSPSSFKLYKLDDKVGDVIQVIDVAFEAENGFGGSMRGQARCNATRDLLITAQIDGNFLLWSEMAASVGADRIVPADDKLRLIAEEDALAPRPDPASDEPSE